VNAATVQGLGPEDLEGAEGPQGPDGPQGPEGPQGPPGEDAEVDILDARVSRAGTLQHGSGIESVSNPADGIYVVVFDRDDISECTITATSEVFNEMATAEIVHLPADDRIWVTVRSFENDTVNRAINVLAYC
jgi:hypothetical protein